MPYAAGHEPSSPKPKPKKKPSKKKESSSFWDKIGDGIHDAVGNALGGGSSGDAPWAVSAASHIPGDISTMVSGIRGMPAYMKHVGGSAASDIGKIVESVTRYSPSPASRVRRSGEFKLDDDVDQITQVYQDIFGPATHGNFKETGRRLAKYAEEDPVFAMLDLLTVVTLGSAGVGSAAARVTKASAGGSRSAKAASRVAGLEEVAEITAATQRPMRAKDGTTYGARSHKIRSPLSGETMGEVALPRNPLVRGRRVALENIYEHLPNRRPVSYMRPENRGARIGERGVGNIARRDQANVEVILSQALKPLSKEEKRAVFYAAQGFDSVDRIDALMRQRAWRIAQVMSEYGVPNTRALQRVMRKSGLDDVSVANPTRKSSRRTRALKAADIVDLAADYRTLNAARRIIAGGPSEHFNAAVAAVHEVSRRVQEVHMDNLMSRGYSREQALAQIEARSTAPLRVIGIEPEALERPAIISHVLRGARAGKGPEGATALESRAPVRGNVSLTRGLNERRLAEEMRWEGENFLNARLDPNPEILAYTHRLMSAKRETFGRMQRAIASGVRYDHDMHAGDVKAGKLVLLRRDTKLIKDLQKIDATFDDVLSKQIDNWDESDVDTLRDAWDEVVEEAIGKGSPGVVIPVAQYNFLKTQVEGAHRVLHALGKFMQNNKLMQEWRAWTLTLKGTFYVNNFLGNTLLGLVSYGPRFMADVATETMPRVLRSKTSRRIEDEVADLARTSGTMSVTQRKHARWQLASRLGGFVGGQGVKITENNFRRGAFKANLRKQAKAYAKATGRSFDEAVDAIFNDKQAIEQLAEKTYGDLLDYSKLTPFERDLMLTLFPFWNFARSMFGRSVRLVLDEPWKAWVLVMWGQEGVEITREALGTSDMPGYVEGNIIGDEVSPGRFESLGTYGANPFSVIPDYAGMLGIGGVEGTNPISQMSPLIKVPIEAATGRDLFFDSELTNPDGSTPHGAIEKIIASGRKQIPLLSTYDKLHYPSASPTIERTPAQVALQYMGYPVGILNMNNVAQSQAINDYYENMDESKEERRVYEREQRARW